MSKLLDIYKHLLFSSMYMWDFYYISSSLQELQCVSEDSRIINSVLEGEVHIAAGAVVQHCHLQVMRTLHVYHLLVV